jgi:hypothetical protein
LRSASSICAAAGKSNGAFCAASIVSRPMAINARRAARSWMLRP